MSLSAQEMQDWTRQHQSLTAAVNSLFLAAKKAAIKEMEECNGTGK